MQRILSMLIATALALVVFAAPATAQDEPQPLLPVMGGCALDHLETYESLEDIGHWVELHGLGWQVFNASVAVDAPLVTYILPATENDTRQWVDHGSLYESQCTPAEVDFVRTAASNFVLNDESHSGLIVNTATCQLYDITMDGDAITEERAEFIDSTLASIRVNQNVVLCPLITAADAMPFGF